MNRKLPGWLLVLIVLGAALAVFTVVSRFQEDRGPSTQTQEQFDRLERRSRP